MAVNAEWNVGLGGAGLVGVGGFWRCGGGVFGGGGGGGIPGGGGFLQGGSEWSGVAEEEIVAAEEGVGAEGDTEGIDGAGETLPGVVAGVVREEFEWGWRGEAEVVDVGEFESDAAEAHAAFPGAAEQGVEEGVDFGLDVRGFGEAFGDLMFIEVVVADFDGERADGALFGPDGGEELIGHFSECGLDAGFIGLIFRKGFLVAVGFGGGGCGDDGPGIDGIGELFEEWGMGEAEAVEEVGGGVGDLADGGEAGAVESIGELWADAGEPTVGQGVEELEFLARGDMDEGVGLSEFGGDLTDEFVGADALADGDFEAGANGFAESGGNFEGGFPGGGEVGVAFIDRGDFDVGREVVGIGKHPLGEALVFFEIAGKDDEVGAEAPGAGGGHGGFDAESAGLVGGGGDDAAAFAADGDRPAAKPGIGSLFDGGVEGIGVQMDDLAWGWVIGWVGHGGRQSWFASTQEGDHDALDDEFGGGDEFWIAGVFGAECRGFPAFEDEGFECAFVVDEGGDDIAVARGDAVFEDDRVSIEDMASDHGIAPDLEGEGAGGGADAEGGDIDGDAAVGFLLLVACESCGDGAVDGNGDGGLAEGVDGGGGAESAGLAGRAGDESFAAEGADVISGGGHAAEAKVGGDFAQGRRGAVAMDLGLDELQDLGLARGWVHGVGDMANCSFEQYRVGDGCQWRESH